MSNIFQFFLFADDTTIFYQSKPQDNVSDIINKELVNVSNWLSANKLNLNVSKSNFLHFHHGQLHSKPSIDIKINGIKVDEKDSTKYLGVIIDNKLNWKLFKH